MGKIKAFNEVSYQAEWCLEEENGVQTKTSTEQRRQMMDGQRDTWMDRQMNRWMDGLTGRQTDG